MLSGFGTVLGTRRRCEVDAPLTLSPSVLFLLKDALILSIQPARAPQMTQEDPGWPMLG